jgi:AbrB family looped-hinge helix DNA binding protein
MTNKVGERFQITIDKAAREQLGVQPGDQAVEWVEDGRLVVAFLPRPHRESMLGILKSMTGRTIEPITDWQALKDAAWTARSREVIASLHREPDPDEQHEPDSSAP